MLRLGNWYGIKDGDARGFALYQRHYSSLPYADGRRSDPSNPARYLFVGPGQKMVLLTADSRALFVWRKFIDKSDQHGINCAVFRNESNVLSSELILEAEQLAWRRWPGERLYTYVNGRKIISVNPGFCFKKAGWQLVRNENGKPLRTTKNLYILEKFPDRAEQK